MVCLFAVVSPFLGKYDFCDLQTIELIFQLREINHKNNRSLISMKHFFFFIESFLSYLLCLLCLLNVVYGYFVLKNSMLVNIMAFNVDIFFFFTKHKTFICLENIPFE